MKERFQKWSQLIVIFVMILFVRSTESGLVDITYVQNAEEKGAVCLDGSPPAYNLDWGFGDGVNNWLLYIEGGAWCENVTSCVARQNLAYGSSYLKDRLVNFTGIISNEQRFNPDFYNWNRVKVRYCDGSSFTGDIEAVDPETKVYYRGARIFRAVIEELLDKGMKFAQNAMLSGCSAGGLAVILNCDNFQSLLPATAKVKCFSDAGFFINAPDITENRHIQHYFHDVVTTHGSAKNLPQSCTSKMNSSLCFFAQNVAREIQTPLFILNSEIDSWQINNTLVRDVIDPSGSWQNCKLNLTKCSDTQLQTILGFGEEFVRILKGLGDSTTRGYFISSCHVHCHIELQDAWFAVNSPKLGNKSIAEAAGNWFFDRSLFQHIDCPYPCDKTCLV